MSNFFEFSKNCITDYYFLTIAKLFGLLNIGNKGIEQEMLNLDRVRLVRPEFTPQIRLRRNHLHGQVSRGTSESKVDNLKTGCLRSDPIDSKTKLRYGLSSSKPAAHEKERCPVVGMLPFRI